MEQSEQVREVMRRWASAVAVVTTRQGDILHGMTVNSFTSISLEPPVISVAMVNLTRTCAMVRESRVLAFTFLCETQQELSERFAGKIPEEEDRLAGLDTFTMTTGSPLLCGGLAYLDCRVIFEYPLPLSTLYLAEVVAAKTGKDGLPLIYHNRSYPRLALPLG